MKQAETAAVARNAVIYARYSSHNQTEQSIEGQLRVCHEYAQREGFTIVGEYIDRAISGKTDDRPDFQRMISDSRKRAFQYVIVYKLDRFARNRYDSAVYKHKLKQNGVKVVSAMENIGDNPESIILEAVLEASAEYYSLELAQKIKRGMRESALKGQFCGGGIPFGYKSAGGRLVIDEAKAPFVKKAFEQYAAGVPQKQIIEELNAVGLRNRNGKPFGNTALQVALQSEKYIGILRWNDIVIENGCPALIDRETFDKVQERIKQNKREGGKNKAKIEYLLTSKVFCGYCGGTVTGVSGTGRHGDIHYYYCCRNRRLRKGCKKAHEKKDLFDMEFRRRIIDTFINSVYLYDDRAIVFYNIRGGKQVSYIDMLDATEGFPGLDDEPAPADSAETPDAKKKPDTASGVRLLNGMVDLKGIEP